MCIWRLATVVVALKVITSVAVRGAWSWFLSRSKSGCQEGSDPKPGRSYGKHLPLYALEDYTMARHVTVEL